VNLKTAKELGFAVSPIRSAGRQRNYRVVVLGAECRLLARNRPDDIEKGLEGGGATRPAPAK